MPYIETAFENAYMNSDMLQCSNSGGVMTIPSSILTLTVSEYIREFIQKCDFCTSHHYTPKHKLTIRRS